MSGSKLHHYLPQFYLKSFTAKDGLVWTYDREKQRYLRLPPKVIAAENDFYSLPTEDVRTRTVIENMLAKYVEAPVAPVINKVTSAYRPTQPELEYLALFVSFQWMRVPGVHEQMETLMKEFVGEFTRFSFETRERVLAGFEDMRRETGEEFDIDPEKLVNFVKSGEWDIRIAKHAVLKMMLDQALDMVPVLGSLDWTFLFAAGNRAFLTSDVPFVVVPPYGSARDTGVGILTPGAVKYLPLSPAVCLRLGEHGYRRSMRIVDGAVVRTVNANIAANSERFIFAGDEAVLRRAVSIAHVEGPNYQDRLKVTAVEASNGGRYMIGSFLSHARYYHDQM